MKLTCNHNPGDGGPEGPDCGQPAAILILSTVIPVLCRGTAADGAHTTESIELLVAVPVCADHAPEEVHEAKACMAPDDFTIVKVAFDVDLEAVIG